MFLSRLASSLLLGTLMVASQVNAQHLSSDGGVQTFNFIAEQFFSDVYFHFAPTAATTAGLHQYDNQLEDFSAANIQKEIAALHAYEKRVEAIAPSALDAAVAGDRQILLNNIRSQLLTLEVIRPWEKNPDIYSTGITNAAFVIMERPYASSKPAKISKTRPTSTPKSPSNRSTMTSASFRTTSPPPSSPAPKPLPTTKPKPPSPQPTPPSSTR